MQAEIISMGMELLTGAAVDTNSAWLSERLARLGVPVRRHVTVGDERSAITTAVREASRHVELLILTGGLGPTKDDVARQALAEATGQPLETRDDLVKAIEKYFASVGRSMSPSNRQQAMIPRGATALPNEWGTAPGIRAALDRATIFALPGVPREMEAMFEHYIVPFVTKRASDRGLALRVVRTYGTGESLLAEKIADLMDPARNPAVGTTASEGIISVRIVARADSAEAARRLAAQDVDTVRARLRSLVYGEDDDTLASVIGQTLIAQSATVSTAESCTGGLIGKLLTDISGSSAYYLGGFVTYSNEQKVAAIGVPPELIETHGAVSEEVARAMADCCHRTTASDYAIAVTGIAGPGGGTKDKPVGLVHIALATPQETTVKECRFSEQLGREAIRDRSAKTALNLLRLTLAGTNK